MLLTIFRGDIWERDENEGLKRIVTKEALNPQGEIGKEILAGLLEDELKRTPIGIAHRYLAVWLVEHFLLKWKSALT